VKDPDTSFSLGENAAPCGIALLTILSRRDIISRLHPQARPVCWLVLLAKIWCGVGDFAIELSLINFSPHFWPLGLNKF
jgi:hypothetical protein